MTKSTGVKVSVTTASLPEMTIDATYVYKNKREAPRHNGINFYRPFLTSARIHIIISYQTYRRKVLSYVLIAIIEYAADRAEI